MVIANIEFSLIEITEALAGHPSKPRPSIPPISWTPANRLNLNWESGPHCELACPIGKRSSSIMPALGEDPHTLAIYRQANRRSPPKIGACQRQATAKTRWAGGRPRFGGKWTVTMQRSGTVVGDQLAVGRIIRLSQSPIYQTVEFQCDVGSKLA